jgi:hypothetical protein
MNAVAPIADAKANIDPLGHLDPKTREAWRQSAREWRAERDRREPLERDLEAERRSLIRDFICEALDPAGNDLDSCIASLANDDDVGAAYHLRRVIISLKAASLAFKGLAA